MSEIIRSVLAPAPSYFYRRRLDFVDVMRAVGVGLGAGIAAFYLATLLLERTPLVASAPAKSARPRGREGKRALAPRA